MTDLSVAPAEIEGHNLLAGKVVVVTAAAGAGIGAAVGTYLGQQAGDMAHHRYRAHTAER